MEKRISSTFTEWLLPALYFSGCFFYILWKLDPALYYQCQVPPFLWDDIFFQSFVTFPGGLAGYMSNLLSQFYYHAWSGALIITACLLFTYLLTRSILDHFSSELKNSVIVYLPTVLLLMLFSQYEHRLAHTLGWLQTLAMFLFYLKMLSKPMLARLPLFLALGLIIYYTSAGFLILFAVLVILSELLLKHRPLLSVIYLVFTILIPYLAQARFFILTMKSAYFYLLMPVYDYRPAVLPYLLFLSLPSLMLSVRIRTDFRFYPHFIEKIPKRIAVLFTALITLAAALWSFDRDMFTTLKVDYYARHRQWEKLLQFVRAHPSDDVLVSFQTNRALFHSGRLSSEMFSYNQNWGMSGLFLPQEVRKFFCLQVSDLYWDMGFLNEAQHWILEDHSNIYNSPWHLQRLAEISISKGNRPLAEMCLEALSKTILYRGWADSCRQHIDDPGSAAGHVFLAYRRNSKIGRDFIVNMVLPEKNIEALLALNRGNRMAFEYLIADYMLTFRIGMLIPYLQSADEILKTTLPRHYQEALLVFMHNTGWPGLESLRPGIDDRTMAEFAGFLNILRSHGDDALAARSELNNEFGHTYWYYSLYNNPNMNKTSS